MRVQLLFGKFAPPTSSTLKPEEPNFEQWYESMDEAGERAGETLSGFKLWIGEGRNESGVKGCRESSEKCGLRLGGNTRKANKILQLTGRGLLISCREVVPGISDIL